MLQTIVIRPIHGSASLFSITFNEGIEVNVNVNTGFVTISSIIRALKLAYTDKQVVEATTKWLKSATAVQIASKLLKDDCGRDSYVDEESEEVFVHPAMLLARDDLGVDSLNKLLLISIYCHTFSQMLISFGRCDEEFLEERIRSLNKRILTYNTRSIRNDFHGSYNEDMRAVIKDMRDDSLEKLILCCRIEIAILRWIQNEDLEHIVGVPSATTLLDDEEPTLIPTMDEISFEIGEIKSERFFGNIHKLKFGGYLFVLPSGDNFITSMKFLPIKSVLRYIPFGFCGITKEIGEYTNRFFPPKKTAIITVNESQKKIIKTKIAEYKVMDFGWLAMCVK